jgi:hypothetical protein
MLTQEEKQDILSNFPNLKLSYETVVHNKVYNCDVALAIPSGIKCFAWFTTFNDKFVCILCEIENASKKQIKDIRIINTCFSSSLCYGTLLYGTLFNHKNNNFFCIEDIAFYKGTDMSRENWSKKFNKIFEILKCDIKQIAYNKQFIVFGMPVLASSNEKLDVALNKVQYKIHNIQYYQFNKTNLHFSLSFDKFANKMEKTEALVAPKVEHIKEVKVVERIPKYIILEVKPDIQNDIYNLYCLNNISCGIACIPDYKTSTMMNKLFRNIKENADLDALEESDDEFEFENPNIDKFVYLDRSFKMKCHYNKRFKKWTPIEVVYNNELSTNNDVTNFIKNLLGNQMKNYK